MSVAQLASRELILFDLDGTLVDSAFDLYRAMNMSLNALQLPNVTAAETLMIGDSSNDVEAARRAGVDCIVVSYGYNHGEDIRDCQPQQVVDDLTELFAK